MTLKLLDLVAQIIFDKKGINILALDLRGISSMADYFILAEGNADRHVQAIAASIVEVLDSKGLHLLQKEGERFGDWIVLDFGDLVVHLFAPGMREKYQLEAVWRESKIVDLNIIC